MAGSQKVGGVQIVDKETNRILDKLDVWPEPMPQKGDVLVFGPYILRVVERRFRMYGMSWGLTLMTDFVLKSEVNLEYMW